MQEYNREDLAGFIQDYFGEEIHIKGESINVQEVFSSEELIQYAEGRLKEGVMENEEIVIMANLIDEEVCRVRSVRHLLNNVISTLKQK